MPPFVENVEKGLKHSSHKSRTQIKREMLHLQETGLRLATLSLKEQQQIDLPDDLLKSLHDYKNTKQNGAKHRQGQWIGRLMRDLHQETLVKINTFLALKDGKDKVYIAYLKRLEQTRNALMEDAHALTEYLNAHPQVDATYLRQLLRKNQEEIKGNKPRRAYKEIFRLLKAIEPYLASIP